MNDEVLILERKIKLAAKVAHNVNQAYCRAIGDPTQEDWENCPKWQRESCIAGVKFHLEHPDSTPEDSHKSWLEHKERDGWTYGQVKDEALKTHPCFVPYDQLPLEQRVKDYLFKAVIDSIMK